MTHNPGTFLDNLYLIRQIGARKKVPLSTQAYTFPSSQPENKRLYIIATQTLGTFGISGSYL
jgi:hypothetical protein